MQGPWEVVFHSTVSPDNYTVLEANLTQAGTHVFAGRRARWYTRVRAWHREPFCLRCRILVDSAIATAATK